MEKYRIMTFHQIFIENSICLSKRLGIEIISNFEPIEGYTYIIFGAHEKAVELYQIQQQVKNIKYVILNSESPLSQVLRNKYYIYLMRENVVFDYSPISTEKLNDLGINVLSQFVFEFLRQDAVTTERDIDIFFCGTHTTRRVEIFETLKSRYPDKNIVFNFDWKYADQNELTKALCRSKVVLNIPYYNHTIIETHRIHKALSCGCNVVSLFSGDKETDLFYGKYIYMVDDFSKYFDKIPALATSEKKLGYEHLMSVLKKKTQYNNWVLKMLS